VSDAQSSSGAYPDIAPQIGVTGSGNAGWADAGILVPWLIYQRTGNIQLLERQYASMRRYVRFLAADNVGGIRHGGRYGDWLALERPTSLELIGTAYVAHSAALLVRIARLLGRDADADEIGRLAATARNAFRRRFTTAPGTLGEETQTGYALALGFDLLPRAARAVAAGRLAALIEAADGHLLTGFLGTGLVLPALSDHGYHELAGRLARQDTFPSWGYQVRQGATTIWERWNSWTPEDGFADPGMNSLNHAALGSVADWLHERIAGLGPGEPGYRTMLVRPGPAAGIEWARASHESSHGHHAVEWTADARRLEVTVDVPPNTFAEVVVPIGHGALSVDGRRARSGGGPVLRVASSARERRLTLSWGRHVVEVAR
jgi:alpha-L-rhamnosidase